MANNDILSMAASSTSGSEVEQDGGTAALHPPSTPAAEVQHLLQVPSAAHGAADEGKKCT